MEHLPFSVLMVCLVIGFVLIVVGAALMFGQLLFGWFVREPAPRDSIDALADSSFPTRR